MPGILIGLGCLLRLALYLDNRSISSAEAMLPLHLIDKPLGDIMGIVLRQEATGAIGFVLMEQVAVLVLGPGELALRFIPLVSGLLAVFLFRGLAFRCLGPTAAVIALGLFAFSPRLILYSTVAKQYSLEVAIAILGSIALVDCIPIALSWRRGVLLAALGGLSVWVSNSIPLVMAGVGGGLAVWYMKGKSWTNLYRFTLVCLVWLLSWAVYQSVWLMPRLADPDLVNYWRADGAFLPSLASVAGLQWLGSIFLETMSDPLGFRLEPAAGIALLLGLGVAYSRSSLKLLLLGLPILVTLAAAGVEKFPFSGRVVQFLAPAMLLLIAEGAGWAWERTPRWLGVGLLGVLCLPPAWSALYHSVIRPKVRADVRSLVDYLEEHGRDTDILYVYRPGRYGFQYYQKTRDLGGMRVILGGMPVGDRSLYLREEVESLRGHERVWFLLAHVHRKGGVSDERLLVRWLDEMGRRLDSLRAKRTWLYLYDLR